MDQPTWQLYGTLGCHLCERAEQLLEQFGDTRALRWHSIDIAELPEAQMLALAQQIPVLTTEHGRLTWPFSLVDLMQVYQQDMQAQCKPDTHL